MDSFTDHFEVYRVFCRNVKIWNSINWLVNIKWSELEYPCNGFLVWRTPKIRLRFLWAHMGTKMGDMIQHSWQQPNDTSFISLRIISTILSYARPLIHRLDLKRLSSEGHRWLIVSRTKYKCMKMPECNVCVNKIKLKNHIKLNWYWTIEMIKNTKF